MELNSDKIPSNQEIIEDLTRDLQSQQLNENPPDHDIAASDSDEESTNKIESKVCHDLIDEEELRKINDSLSPEEKNERLFRANDLKKKGNDLFKNCQYLDSIKVYTDALKLYPLEHASERSIVYANRAASKLHINCKESAVDDCTKSIELNPNYVRAILRRAKLYEEREKLDESLEDYKKILELDPGNKEAIMACQRLPPIINERNEKMKSEMLGKLKDLGNMVLKPFGLSTNNFKLQQDPSTGSYSINFQQNT
ncbi:hypothetical protein PPYR_12391 [Photinus pyralis]|uniref:Uncharacterized protein n=1 Tax=Photinus pyralis TaxID=7054 RepID=A0A1Y1MSK3_PHOPY|nr:tetratricopeptide repeat protein 1 [Photinus pyralis]KAB0795552.1 hypothetical protein PPYR_12391 [Photinus pyralis]